MHQRLAELGLGLRVGGRFHPTRCGLPGSREVPVIELLLGQSLGASRADGVNGNEPEPA